MIDFARLNFFCGDNGIQEILWKSVFLAVLALSPTSSYALTFQGVGLKEEFLVPLDGFESRYILVRAKQSSADYVLAVNSPDGDVDSIIANFPSGNGLDELLLVDRERCHGCNVSIRPFEMIDSNSSYHLAIEEFSRSEAVVVEAYQEMTHAAEWRSKSRVAVDGETRSNALEKSVAALTKTAELAGDINDQELRLHALTLLAEAYYRLGLEDKQKGTLQTVLDETEGSESIYRALAFFEFSPLTGNIKSMIDYCRKGMEVGQRIKNSWVVAKGANFTGRFLVGGGWPEQGKTLINRSKDIFAGLKNWREFSTPLHNLSWAEQRAGNYVAALKYATDQLAHANQYDDEEGRIWALYNFGLAHSENGDIYKAEMAMDDAFKRLKALPFRSNSTISILKGAIAEYKYKGALVFGDYLLAASHLKTTKQLFKEQGWPSLVADSSYYEAELALESGRIEDAESLLLEVLAYDIENNRLRSKARVLQTLTRLEIAKLNVLKSHEYVVASIRAAGTTNDKKLLAKSLVNAVEVTQKSKAFGAADEIAIMVQPMVRRYAGEKDKVRFQFQRALVKRGLNDLESANRYVKNARVSIEFALKKVVRQDHKREYLALQKAVYELGISLIEGSTPEAILKKLNLAEAYKARTLSEAIENRGLVNEIEIANSSIQRGIHGKIIENAIAIHTGEKEREKMLISSRELYGKLAKLEAKVRAKNVVEKKENIEIASDPSDDIRDSINIAENELLAYYFLGSEKSWLWIISDENMNEYELAGSDSIGEIVEEYMGLLSTPPAMRIGGLSRHLEVSDLASQEILAPIVDYLSDTEINHITIIPDDVLHGLPFSSLKLPGSTKSLVSRVAVSYTPSLNVRENIQKNKVSKLDADNAKVFAMANPKGLSDRAFRFAELPHSLAEVEALGEILGTNLQKLTGDEASKIAVLNELKNPYQILHFATHGLINAREPALSGLLFSSPDKENSIWIAPEISTTQIQADLIVLSACETAGGRSIRGEGLMSLSRAFMEAGANRVIGSGWKVGDHATSELMKHFYKFLLTDKLNVASALRNAKTTIMKDNQRDWSDPYYWAGFQLQGGEEAI